MTFDLNQYKKQIKKEITGILSSKSSVNIRFDILDSEKESSSLLISLKTKQKQMKYGKIWEIVIGYYENFERLLVGNESGLDIISTKRKIIMELKNSFNTDNSSSLKANIDKLEKFKFKNPEYRIIYGVINDRNITGRIIKKYKNSNVEYYSGIQLFQLIFDKNSDNIISFVKSVVSSF